MFQFVVRLISLFVLLRPAIALAGGKAEHVVLIVWDGMRPDFISTEHTPALSRLAGDGVLFQNHHAVYCSATEVNGTAMATGAYPEHSGVIANNLYLPAIDPLGPTSVQDTAAVRKGDMITQGHYLLRPTLAELLHAAGRTTVVAAAKEIGLLHDRRERTETSGSGVNLFEGKSLPPGVLAAITNQLGAFPAPAPLASDAPNEPRDEWTTRALLGPLWSNGVPAFTLLWLSEPDYSQHARGPGSAKALAALESSDRKLAAVLAELDKRGLRGKTDVFVVSDHGFSTIAASVDVPKVLRDAGFTAYRKFKSAPQPGEIVVAGQGGSVLFYVIGHDAAVGHRLVDFLQERDFTGVLFTHEKMEGTFTLEQAHINARNGPDVVLSMRWTAEKSAIGVPGVFTSDGARQPGEGNHASLSRFDLHNILVGAGPDLKPGFKDELPSANTDLAPTILWLLGVKADAPMDGRVLSEALTVDAPPVKPAPALRLEAQRGLEHTHWHQYLQTSQVNDTVYLDEGNGAAEAR